MNLLSVNNCSHSFSDKWLFKDISFGLEKGDKKALVGHNGAGKSTLLKIIAKQIVPDNGEITFHQNTSVIYVSQDPNFNDEDTIKDVVIGNDNPIIKTIKSYEKTIADVDCDADKLNDLIEKMELYEAWNFDKQIEQTLNFLGIDDINKKISQLSGGQKKRVALAQAILFKPDLLLLDEPTNHLDLKAVEWLETILNSPNLTVLIITHDRYFLDNVVNEILEIDKANMYFHKGKYINYLENKNTRKEIEEVEKHKLKQVLKQELEWMRKMPKARGTKSKSRIQNYSELKEKNEQYQSDKKLEMDVVHSRLGNRVIEVENLSFAYNDKVLVNDFSYRFLKQENVGLIGKNGAGKSTLIKLLTNELKPKSGTINHGETVKIGYFSQENENLNLENKIIDEVKQIAEYVELSNGDRISVSKLLDMFLFSPSFQQTPIHKLSGGEKKRLQLLKVLATQPNFLILDEPTNDLDIDTLNVLQEFLQNFNGCLLLVSHDRYFLDVLTEKLLIFEEAGFIKEFHGNYTDYIVQKEIEEKEKEKQKASEKKVIKVEEKPKPISKKKSFKEQQEFINLENEIAELEKTKSEKMKMLQSSELNHIELSQISNELLKLDKLLDEKSMRWMELSELE